MTLGISKNRQVMASSRYVRYTTAKCHLNVRDFPRELKNRLDNLAAKRNMPLKYLMIEMIEQYVDAQAAAAQDKPAELVNSVGSEERAASGRPGDWAFTNEIDSDLTK